jgi:hypothetical protein
MEMTEQYA